MSRDVETPELDFQMLFMEAPTPFMVLGEDWRIREVNDCYCEVTGQSRDALIGSAVFDMFPEADERIAIFRDAFQRAFDGETNFVHEQRFDLPRSEAEGGGMREVWWTCGHTPIEGADGVIRHVMQHARDVTEEVAVKRLKEMIAGELEHRVANLFALVQVIARRSAKGQTDLDAFVRDFESRIDSLARTHAGLTGDNWGGLGLRALAQRQFEGLPEAEAARVTLDGPEIALTARDAQMTAMALHELTTNAMKHGALGAREGRVALSWAKTEGGGWRVDWRESGIGFAEAPTGEGFGSLILTRLLPQQLHGEVERRFDSEGHLYSLRVTPRG